MFLFSYYFLSPPLLFDITNGIYIRCNFFNKIIIYPHLYKKNLNNFYKLLKKREKNDKLSSYPLSE